MKIIKPSAVILHHEDNKHYEIIEKVGRVCYKSHDSIKDGSAEKFVNALVKSRHLAMLEHEHIYLDLQNEFMNLFLKLCRVMDENLEFFNITNNSNNKSILSGSFRSFFELYKRLSEKYNHPYYDIITKKDSPLMMVLDKLKSIYPLIFERLDMFPIRNSAIEVFDIYVLSTSEFKECYKNEPSILRKHLIHTVHFICDRGVTHEFVRHRPCSFAQESTRYCNYSKDKFGNEITVILPLFFDTGMGTASNSLVYETWKYSCEVAERKYFELWNYAATPQEARSVLPNSLKTELVITATEEEWQHIVNLRYLGTTGSPHPQIKEVMGMIVKDLSEESGGRIKYEANKETN